MSYLIYVFLSPMCTTTRYARSHCISELLQCVIHNINAMVVLINIGLIRW